MHWAHAKRPGVITMRAFKWTVRTKPFFRLWQCDRLLQCEKFPGSYFSRSRQSVVISFNPLVSFRNVFDGFLRCHCPPRKAQELNGRQNDWLSGKRQRIMNGIPLRYLTDIALICMIHSGPICISHMAGARNEGEENDQSPSNGDDSCLESRRIPCRWRSAKGKEIKSDCCWSYLLSSI
jgi:hypothetical protein